MLRPTGYRCAATITGTGTWLAYANTCMPAGQFEVALHVPTQAVDQVLTVEPQDEMGEGRYANEVRHSPCVRVLRMTRLKGDGEQRSLVNDAATVRINLCDCCRSGARAA